MDQYAIRFDNITQVFWNDLKPEESEPLVSRQNWTESFVNWSPHGTYLLTIHQQGVALWGSPQWNRIIRLEHRGVKLIDFSPCEKFLVTFSPLNLEDSECIVVWDVRTGQKLQTFPFINSSSTDSTKNFIWPFFKWSYDDKYLAYLNDNCIFVYETPSLELIDKQPIKIEGVKDFSWSKSDLIISYFIPEMSDKPASVVLMEIPSRTEKRQKNLFNVINVFKIIIY